MLIAARHHRFAQQPHVASSEMRDETLFIYPPREESRVLQEVLLPAGVVAGAIEEVQLTEAITELVKAGLGVARAGAVGGAAAHRRRARSSRGRSRRAACIATWRR